LYPNYPTPFNPGTAIRFDVPEAERVRIEVFSLIGKRVAVLADGGFGPGTHAVRWDGKDEAGNPVGSGIYFCRMQAGDFVRILKMQLIR
jgi:flagellar hook assembly protein FlgD